MVRSNVDRASLWKVMITLVSGRSSRYFLFRHLGGRIHIFNNRITRRVSFHLHWISGVGYFTITGQGVAGLLVEAVPYVGILPVSQGTCSYVACLIEVFDFSASTTGGHGQSTTRSASTATDTLQGNKDMEGGKIRIWELNTLETFHEIELFMERENKIILL